MNDSSYLNRLIHFAGIATLTLAINSSIAADIGQPISLSKLNIQVKDLTQQLHQLHAQVGKQNTATDFAAFETRKRITPKQVSTRHERNKNRL